MEKFYSPAGYPVFVSGAAEGALTPEQVVSGWEMYKKSSGFMATVFTEEAVNQIALFMAACGMGEESTMLETGPVILVVKEAWDGLDFTERMAIIAHEEAHILNGDCILGEDEPKPEKLTIRHVAEHEIAADRYAASIYGASVVVSALINVVELCIVKTAEHFGQEDKIERLRHVAMNNDEFVARLQALRKM